MPIDTLIEEEKKSGHITYMSKIWILRVFREKHTLYLILIVNYFKNFRSVHRKSNEKFHLKWHFCTFASQN